MGKPKPELNPYDRLYKKSLAPEKVDEMKFNLKNYFELLLQMDQQYQELKAKGLTNDDRK